MSSPTLMPDDRRSLTLRLTVIQYIVAGFFALLAVSFWIFQIAQHDRFAEMAAEQPPAPAAAAGAARRAVRPQLQGSGRQPEHASTSRCVREQTRNLDQTLHILAEATGTDEAQLRETVSRRRREPSYRPIVLIENATREQVIAVHARRWELPGIEPRQVPARHYPTSDMAAHLFGYVSEVTEAQLARPEYAGVEAGDIVGQAGVEQAYNRLLMGTEGDRAVVVNSLGREIEDAREAGSRSKGAGCS